MSLFSVRDRAPFAMTTTVSTALAALQIRPDDIQALQALKGVHPGNGAGLDADALSKALSDARRWHRERADFGLCLDLIDLELGFTTRKSDAPTCCTKRGGCSSTSS